MPGAARTAVFVVFVLACADPSRPERGGATWTIDPTPILDIGDAADTLETAGDVYGATRLANGGVAVADRQSSSLRYFSPEGKLVRQVGRRGGGPGEFEQLGWLKRCGDSLVVLDRGSSKYRVLSLDGTVRRTFELAGPAPGEHAYRSACYTQGVLVSYGWPFLRDLPKQSGVTRATTPFWLSNSDGTLLANLGRFAGSERWATVEAHLGSSGPLPLGKEPAIAVGRERVYVGTADSFAIHVFALDGSARGTLQIPRAVRATTSADIERFKLLDTTGATRERAATLVSRWARMRFPPTLPAYSMFVVDRDDNLWVQTYPVASESDVTWIVFSPTGGAMAQVKLPHTLAVDEIGDDYILGTDTDVQSGMKRVKVFRLRRSA